MFKKYSFIFCNSIVYNLIYVQALPNHNARHVRNFIISLSWLSSLHLLTSSPFQVLSWKLFGLVRGKCISILCPLSPHTMSWCPASKLTESFRSNVTSLFIICLFGHIWLFLVGFPKSSAGSCPLEPLMEIGFPVRDRGMFQTHLSVSYVYFLSLLLVLSLLSLGGIYSLSRKSYCSFMTKWDTLSIPQILSLLCSRT